MTWRDCLPNTRRSAQMRWPCASAFIAVLLDNGFPPQLAARTYATLSHYVLGFAIQLGGDRATGALDDAQLSAVFAGLNPAGFPPPPRWLTRYRCR